MSEVVNLGSGEGFGDGSYISVFNSKGKLVQASQNILAMYPPEFHRIDHIFSKNVRQWIKECALFSNLPPLSRKEKTDKSDKSDSPEKAEKSEKSDKSEAAGKSEKVEKKAEKKPKKAD